MFESFEALLARYAATGSLISRQGRRTYRSFLTVNSPASAAALADLEAWLGCTLPADYRAFLQRWTGASMYALEHDHHPSFAASDLVPALQDQYEQDPRVLVIGQSDDEGFFLLDRRDTRAAVWPFYWADELQPMDELLDSPPLAPGFSTFLDDFIAAEGEWYWQVRPRVPWSWAEQQLNWWVHGGGLALRLEPRAYVGQPPTTWSVMFSITATPPGLLLAAGLRTHFLALGGLHSQRTSHDWQFAFPPEDLPRIDPASIPVAPSTVGWQEVSPDVWVYGDGLVGLVAERAPLGDRSVHRVGISWRIGHGDAAVSALRHRLAKYTNNETWPEYLPDEYEAVSLDFWKDRPHEIRPDQ